MKKTLVALAALASVSAFAQSSVTMSGNLDVAYGHQSGNAVQSGNTIATTGITSTTSVINLVAVEDLGGGTKVTAKYGLDPRALTNDNATSKATVATTNGGYASMNRDEAYVGIEGKMGNLRLGSPNSVGLGAWGAVSPLGTGIGSGFTTANAVMAIRFDRSVRYDSPSFNGLTFSALQAQGTKTADVVAITSSSTTTNSAVNTMNGANANRRANELGVTYANGPLAVALVNISQPADGSTYVKTSSNVLGGQYKLGSTTLYAAYIKGDLLKSTASATTEVKGTRYAVKQNLGNVDLIASYLEVEATANGTKAKTTGLRADYNLSKTAAVYAGYEKLQDKTGAIVAVSGTDTRNLVSVGLRKSF